MKDIPEISLFVLIIFFFCNNIENMAANIRAELKRLQRRKQLQYSSQMENSDGSSSGGENSESPSRSERALFTFRQVGLICERMLREKESEIREEYDNVLTAKLAEQYEAFVKFTYDQIQRNYQAAPSCKSSVYIFFYAMVDR